MHDVIAKCIQSMETVAINGFLVDYYRADILFQYVHIHYS